MNTSSQIGSVRTWGERKQLSLRRAVGDLLRLAAVVLALLPWRGEGAVMNFQHGVSPSTAYDTPMTYVRTDNAHTPQDNDPDKELLLGNNGIGGKWHGLLEFDVGSLAVSESQLLVVQSAELIFYVYSGLVNGSDTYRVFAYDYDFLEGTATWSDPDGDGNTATGDTYGGGSHETQLSALEVASLPSGQIVFPSTTDFKLAVTKAARGDGMVRLLVKSDETVLNYLRVRDEAYTINPAYRPILRVQYTILNLSASTYDYPGMFANVQPMTHSMEGRIPLTLWQYPHMSPDSKIMVEHILAVPELVARGIVPMLAPNPWTVEENIALGLAVEAAGQPVHMCMKNPLGTTPALDGYAGIYADALALGPYVTVDNVKYPAAPAYNVANWSGTADYLDALKDGGPNGGVTSLQGCWFDMEYPWGEGWWLTPNAQAQSPNVNTYPSEVIVADYNSWTRYIRGVTVRDVLSQLADHVRGVFPGALIGNWNYSKSGNDYLTDFPFMSLGGMNVSCPVTYPACEWLTNYFGPTEPISVDQAGQVYFGVLLSTFSDACANKSPGSLVLPYLSPSPIYTADPHYRIWFTSSQWVRELVRHALLRGADGFNLFYNVTVYGGSTTPQIAYTFIEDVRAAYDEMLEHRDFLDCGKPVNFDWPAFRALRNYPYLPHNERRPMWSGLWLGDECRVRATSMTDANANITAAVFPGSVPVTFTATPEGASYVFNRLELGGSLIAHWRMESNVVDDLAFVYDGTKYGTLLYENGMMDLAALFNGADARIEVPGLVDCFSMCNAAPCDFTWSSWINTADPSRPCQVLFGENNIGNAGEYARIQLLNGYAEMVIADAEHGTRLQLRAPSAVSAATWRLVTVTRQGNTFTLYLDGESVASGNWTPDTLAFAGGKAFALGCAHGPTLTSFFQGSMDDVRLYDRALGQAEIATLYRLGLGLIAWYPGDDTVGLDASGHNNRGLASGVGLSDDAREGSASLIFNGTNAFMDLASQGAGDLMYYRLANDIRMSDPNRDFAFSAWFNATNVNLDQTLYSETSGSCVQRTAIKIKNGSVKLFFYDAEDPNYPNFELTTPANLQTDTWYFLTVSKVGNQFAIYTNGLVCASASHAGTLMNKAANYSIGCERGYSGVYLVNLFGGKMDDIQFYEKGLTPEAAAQLWDLAKGQGQ